MKYLVYSMGQHCDKKDIIQICNSLNEAKKVEENCNAILKKWNDKTITLKIGIEKIK